jgi:hypothetical protein
MRRQVDVQGKSWKQRKSGKGKLLKTKRGNAGVSKFLVKTDSQGRGFELGYKNKRVAQIAQAHHSGATLKMDAKQAQKNNPATSKPATRNQARRLRELGYKKPSGKKKGRYVRASLSWIVENLTQQQAGIIIRILKDGETKSTKKKWEIELPKRSFLSQSKEEIEAQTKYMVAELARLQST